MAVHRHRMKLRWAARQARTAFVRGVVPQGGRLTAVDGLRIRTVTVEDETARLRTKVARFERRYERTSQEMIDAIRTGGAKETAEISTWLNSYRALTRFDSGVLDERT